MLGLILSLYHVGCFVLLYIYLLYHILPSRVNNCVKLSTYVRWQIRNRCARKEQSLLFDLFTAFDQLKHKSQNLFFSLQKDIFFLPFFSTLHGKCCACTKKKNVFSDLENPICDCSRSIKCLIQIKLYRLLLTCTPFSELSSNIQCHNFLYALRCLILQPCIAICYYNPREHLKTVHVYLIERTLASLLSKQMHHLNSGRLPHIAAGFIIYVSRIAD